MSENEKTPVENNPESNTSGSAEPFSASDEVDSILSDILGADGSYQERYNSAFARYNGTPASPARVMRRHEVAEDSRQPVSPAVERSTAPAEEYLRREEQPSRSRDGELSYRERYERLYGTPAPRRRVSEPDYPQYGGRYSEPDRRRSSVYRLPDDVDRIFGDVHREAQSPDISVNGVKYPTLGSSKSGERVIYDADWEERAQREAAEELQRRMRNPQYDYPTRQRGYYESDFVTGGVPISRAGGADTYRRGVSSLIDPLTQDDSLYSHQKPLKKNHKEDDRASVGEGEKKPFFSQGFPVSPANNAGTANGETSEFTYGEHDAVLDSFSEAYSAQTQREELWKQPVEKGDKPKRKSKNKHKNLKEHDTIPQNTPKNTPAHAPEAAVSVPSAAHAVFPVEDIETQDIAGTISRPEKRVASAPGRIDKNAKKVIVNANSGVTFADLHDNDEKPTGEESDLPDISSEDFFGEEGFDNVSEDGENGVDIAIPEEKELFDLGVFDGNNTEEFKFPERLPKEKDSFGEKFRKFLHNNFPNKGDSKLEVLRKIVMDVSFVTFICAIIYLSCYYVRYREHIADGNELESIADEYNTEYLPEQLEALWANIHAQYPDVVFPEGMNIKFAKLYAVNQDVTGWLTVPGKQISTVIVQTDDNSHYLNRDYFGNNSRYGNPYADYRDVFTKGNLSKNTIIYGHNTHDGLVFASLLDYMKIEGYKSSPVIELDTLYDTTYWKVFAVMLTNANPSEDNGHTFEYLYPSYGSDDAFMSVVEGIKQRSMIHTDIEVEKNDRMLLLYTCYNNIFKNGRLVIAARQVRDGESKEVDTSSAYFNYNARYPQAYYTAMKQDNPYSNADDSVEVTSAPETPAEVTTTQVTSNEQNVATETGTTQSVSENTAHQQSATAAQSVLTTANTAVVG